MKDQKYNQNQPQLFQEQPYQEPHQQQFQEQSYQEPYQPQFQEQTFPQIDCNDPQNLYNNPSCIQQFQSQYGMTPQEYYNQQQMQLQPQLPPKKIKKI